MKLGTFKQHRSWFTSAGIAALITIWLLSGQFGKRDPANTPLTGARVLEAPRSSVRVRTQSAEEITRTIIVNGKTAPARVVELSAETDGRIEHIGAERGTNVNRSAVIVRLDERDRRARLAHAEATVKQRQVEYEGRMRLKRESYVSEAQLQEAKIGRAACRERV